MDIHWRGCGEWPLYLINHPYMLFGTAIPTLLNIVFFFYLSPCNFFFVYRSLPELVYRRFVIKETANILILVWLIELEKDREYMCHGRVFGRKEMTFENLVECRQNCRLHSMYQVWWYLPCWMTSILKTSSFNNSDGIIGTGVVDTGSLSFFTGLQSRPHVATQHDTCFIIEYSHCDTRYCFSYKLISCACLIRSFFSIPGCKSPVQILSISSYWPSSILQLLDHPIRVQDWINIS